MSSLNRKIAGDVLLYHLAGDDQLIDQELLARHGRSSRTLVKDGPLRLTVVALGAGGELATHRAPGMVTIHVLEGEINLAAAGKDHAMKPRDLLVLEPGVEHSARSAAGGVFLLTVAGAAPRS
jgi:quercetin dioxygenase-like cupin family protein